MATKSKKASNKKSTAKTKVKKVAKKVTKDTKTKVVSNFDESKRNVRECVFYNTVTKQAFTCQFNPSNLPRTRSASYSVITSPGMAYPLVQFCSGDIEDMDINLVFYNRESSSKIKSFDKFIDGLLPPKHNKSSFKQPPVFKFYYGNLVDEYVLLKKNTNTELLDEKGNPYYVEYTLTVRRIG